MRKFRVNRAKWRCGGGDSIFADIGVGATERNKIGRGETALLNNEGYMCCLGFACNQLGRVPKRDLLDQGEPEVLDKSIKGFSEERYFDEFGNGLVNTELSDKAIGINDDSSISPKHRENKLTRLFRKHDIEIEFYGEYET